MAAVAVLAVLAVLVLGGSSSKHNAKLATSPVRESTTTSSSTTLPADTSTSVVVTTVVPTTVPAPGASTTTTARAAATTVAPRTNTTVGSTATTISPFFPGLQRSFSITGANPVNTPQGYWDVGSGGAPNLHWSATANAPITVSMSGPGFSSTSPSGTTADLCPGNLLGTHCTVSPGNYSYTLTVSDGHGHSIPETLVLVVRGPTTVTTAP